MSSVTTREWVSRRPRFSKTFDGCLLCRRRHLKCDGERPFCRRCQRDGKLCDGYASVVRALRFELLGDAAEKRSYDYFFDVVAPQIAGHHENVRISIHPQERQLTLLKAFWTTVLRQVSHTSTALLHAIAALGAIEEYYREVETCRRTKLHQFALSQNVQSLNSLRKSMEHENNSILVLLVAAVLHITMELRQGVEKFPAQTQARTAFRLLESSRGHTRAEEAVLNRWIHPMLGRRLLQFEPHHNTQAERRGLELGRSSWQALNICKASMVQIFLGIEEAQHALNSIIESTFTCIHRSASNRRMDEIEHALGLGATLLRDWKVTFDQTVAGLSCGNGRQTLLAQILCQTALAVMQTVISTDHLPSDEEFARQIGCCETFMQLHETTANGGGAFFVDHAVIPGLFFAAVQCREESLSERAVRALQHRRWREGFWDSRDVADEARRVRLLLQEQYLQMSGLLNHQYFGCAWEFLGSSRLIIEDRQGPSMS